MRPSAPKWVRATAALGFVCAIALYLSNRKDEPMEVELDAFSGRSNPTWTLPADKAARVRDALARLPATDAAPRPEGLGYRGFVIRHAGTEARVYRGMIDVTEEGANRTLLDSAGIEAQLAEEARQRGLSDIVKDVAR